MRIQRISIAHWRHFENLSFEIPNESPIVCLVGSNGSGKSQLFELIGAAANRIGLTPGSESTRGNPFAEDAEFEIDFQITPNVIPRIEVLNQPENSLHEAYSTWDRRLLLRHSHVSGTSITAGGVPVNLGPQFASTVIELLRDSKAVHYLSLDADRAYPKVQVQSHEVGAIFERDWQLTSKDSSYRLTRNLYDEWLRYLLATENREGNLLVESIRRAREIGAPEPRFDDPFEGYKAAVKGVLPHLLFVGVDARTKSVHFDSTGIPLNFDQLSGGEREIAFLIGQIERFALRKGLLLVDEPELHLNYDLLRAWIGFLRASVEEGQIWLASHSLEVVETVGTRSTFLLEREVSTRKTKKIAVLADQPVVSTLSRSIGSPAFSLSNIRIALIEGETQIGERERFRMICGDPLDVRFIESGSCREVIRRRDDLRSIAAGVDQTIRVGAIVDRDYRSVGDIANLKARGVFARGTRGRELFP